MSELKSRIQTDLTDAIRRKDEIVTSTLRMVLAAITNEEVSGKVAKELSAQEVIAVLNREAKKRKEAATAFDDAKRSELAERERAELAVIATYLPAALSAEELDQIIRDAIATVATGGQSGPSAMGAVMKIITPQITGRADGAQVAAAVKAALAST